MHEPLPILSKARDGIYPRCVYCLGENYALAVVGYSTRQHSCAAVRSCGRTLPEDYVVTIDPEDDGHEALV